MNNNICQHRGNHFTKDIYIIKNRINDRVYVGQSRNAGQRFISHCKPSSVKNNSLIDKAIQKYGANNFWYEVLEKDVENYNTREKYWIKKLDCIYPNGYNLQQGGENPPTKYGINNPNSKFNSDNIVRLIKNELKNTKKSLTEIANNFNISKKTVLRINQGLTYEELNEEYPIRKVPNMNGKLSNKQVQDIVELLRYSYRQYEDIGRQYGVSASTIKQINAGIMHKIETENYPIRKYKNSGKPSCTYQQVTEISELLKTSSISYNQIAKIYNLDVQSIYLINNGKSKRYRRDEYKYPLRPFSKGYKFKK